jgi:exosome complex exonuclease RRP6
MDLTSDFQTYQNRVTSSLIDVVKLGGQLSNTDLSFHRSSDKVSRSLDQQNARLLRLTNKLLKAATQDSAVKAPVLRDQDGIDDNWRALTGVVDDLLEKADVSLDEFTGAIRRKSPVLPEGNQPSTKTPVPHPARPSFPHVHLPKVHIKPQLLFHRTVDNLNPEPFKPLLVEKPHALKPLAECISEGGAP